MQLNDEPSRQPDAAVAALLALALAMPALPAVAESAPEQGQFSLRYLDYQDSQPGAKRVAVTAPAAYLFLPLSADWSLEGSLVADTVSGASPAYHTYALAGMDDERHARDLRVTRYFPWGNLGVGAAYSKESDYRSRSHSIQAAIDSEDRNTTLHLGIGHASDVITPNNLPGFRREKSITDYLLGVTRVLTPVDVVQLNLGRANGSGYYTDPYKFMDLRPGEKRQWTLLGRWNHFHENLDAASRWSYRYYRDDWGVSAHTLSGELVKTFGSGWTLTPSFRLYSQSAADFYVESTNPPRPTFPVGWVPGRTLTSEDQRLSAFGAVTLGMKIAKTLGRDWTLELKHERYEQRGSWHLGDSDSINLQPLRARFTQAGVTRTF